MLLAAPAMFFWGVGTSTSAGNSIGWTHPQSSAALAVATIVIPALDAFFASRAVERLLDKASIAVNGRAARGSFLCLVIYEKYFELSHICYIWACATSCRGGLQRICGINRGHPQRNSQRIHSVLQSLSRLACFQFDGRAHTEILHSTSRFDYTQPATVSAFLTVLYGYAAVR